MASATRGKRILLIGLFVSALMVIPLFLEMINQGSLAAPFVYGGIIAFTAAFYGLKLSVALSVAAGVGGTLAALLNPYPIPGAIFFGLLTFGAALMARRGLHSPVLTVPIFVSFILVAPPTVAGVSPTTVALVVGCALIAGGLWATAATHLLIGSSLPHISAHPLGWRTTLTYAALMGVLVGAAAWGLLTWARFHEGAWLILTLIIVLQPSSNDTLVRSLQRLAGTLMGGAIALVLIMLGMQGTGALIAGGFAIFVAFALRYVLHQPYWVYVTALTPGAILLSAKGLDATRVAEDRIGFTMLAVVIVVAITLLVKAIAIRWTHTAMST